MNIWEYKVKPSFFRSGMAKGWTKCTEEQTKKLEAMRPNQFEYREIKPPSPTPSMIEKEIESIHETSASKITVTKRKAKKQENKK